MKKGEFFKMVKVYELQKFGISGVAALGFKPASASIEKLLAVETKAEAPHSRLFVFGDLIARVAYNISVSKHQFNPEKVYELYGIEVPDDHYNRVQITVAAPAKNVAKQSLFDVIQKIRFIDTPTNDLPDGTSATYYARLLIELLFKNYSLVIK